MCGITGIWPTKSISKEDLFLMSDAMKHRGPDDKGFYIDDISGLGLAHRRLSILDLSSSGHQPMISPCGKFVLIFNGEIYNHLDLRIELEKEGGAFNWQSFSDTETLLAGLRYWGIEKCLKKINGMFAFALWDKIKQKLFLARDRVGEKPLYYGSNGDTFLFGSELKALTKYPKWEGSINRDALALFMRYNHVPGENSIYQGIKKLPAAHYIEVSEQGRNITSPKCYWSLSKISSDGIAQSKLHNVSSEILINEFDQLLSNAVSSRMLSDVPVGAFFSGGYDSSIVVAKMQALSSSPVKTYSIGIENPEFDEAKHAATIAKHLKTDHTFLYLNRENVMSTIPKIPDIYDEPFADSSQIPTFLVSQLARRDVTVALTGDGGDELFGGYNRHVLGPKIWSLVKFLPKSVRRNLSNKILKIANWLKNDHYKSLYGKFQYGDLRLKINKLADSLKAENQFEFYDLIRSHWKENDLVLDSKLHLPYQSSTNFQLLDQMLFHDIENYLSDDILTKVDRATMATSLEARPPLLDHRLIEFAFRVPSKFKVRNGRGKWLLREVLYRYVPKKIIDRPKKGFGIPLSDWLRGPLRDWAESLLDENKLKQQGYLNSKLVRSIWQDHCNGLGNREHDLWCTLMFQSWLEIKK